MRMKKSILWALMLLVNFWRLDWIYDYFDVSFVDGLYMTIITVSTVGYGEVAPLTPLAKWFSIIFIIFSVGMVGYLVKELQIFLEKTILTSLGGEKK